MSDEEYTIDISPSTLNGLMTGKRVRMVKIRGMDVSLKLTPEARAFLRQVFEITLGQLTDEGWTQALVDRLKRGEYKIEDGELIGPEGEPLRLVKDPKESLH